jgi:hypothetical protein
VFLGLENIVSETRSGSGFSKCSANVISNWFSELLRWEEGKVHGIKAASFSCEEQNGGSEMEH